MWFKANLVLCCLLASCQALAEIISLDQFLIQVKSTHPGFVSTQKKVTGAELKREEAGMMFSPAFFTNLTSSDDHRINLMSIVPYEKAGQKELEFGVMQQSRYGLQSKISYDVKKTTLVGVPASSAVYLPFGEEYFDAALSLEIKQSLWKNSFGSGHRAQEKQAMHSTDATSYAEKFRARIILLDAERAYWRLALAQMIETIQEETFNRTKRLTEWQQRRADDHLSDTADLLAAKAALKGRELELAASRNETRLALKNFNQFRGKKDDEIAQAILPDDAQNLLNLNSPARSNDRDDIKAQRAAVSAKEIGAGLNHARYDATIDVFAKISRTSVAQDWPDAQKESVKGNHPLYVYGLNVSVPLDRDVINKSRRGYVEELEGEKLELESKQRDVENSWIQLNQQLADAKETLSLVIDLEKVQKEKFQAERQRIKNGRTTTYQLFSVEQDYLHAQKSRVQAVAQVMVLLSVMKTYQDGPL